jgi:ankyrin repeat protein
MLGQEEAVELLLANGADAKAKDRDGRTPSELALWMGHKELAELLRPKE